VPDGPVALVGPGRIVTVGFGVIVVLVPPGRGRDGRLGFGVVVAVVAPAGPGRAGRVGFGVVVAVVGVVVPPGRGRVGEIGFGVIVVVVPAGPGLPGKLGPDAVEGAGAAFGPGLTGAPAADCGELVPVVGAATGMPPGIGRTGTGVPVGLGTPPPPPPIVRTAGVVGCGVAVGGVEGVLEGGAVVPAEPFAGPGWPGFAIAFCVPPAGLGFCLGGKPTMGLGATARVVGATPPKVPGAPIAPGVDEVAADVELLFPPSAWV
jgi:hypothetical protein